MVKERKGCEHCCHTGSIPLQIEPGGCSDFVTCPWCGDPTEFEKRTGWKIDEDETCYKT